MPGVGDVTGSTDGCSKVEALSWNTATATAFRSNQKATPKTSRLTPAPTKIVACKPTAGRMKKAVVSVPSTAPSVLIP